MHDGNIFNFAGGCTNCRFHTDENREVVSKQYGNDYNHIWNDDFLKIKNPEEAFEVFNDAEDLYNFLADNV